MNNVKRRVLLTFLALVGLLAVIADGNACGRGRRAARPYCEPPITFEVVHVVEALQANPVVSGTVYDTDGAVLKSPKAGAPATITVKDTAGNTLATTTSNTTTGAYSVTVSTAPQADNIIKVTYKQNNGTETFTYSGSYLQLVHKLHPIVPR